MEENLMEDKLMEEKVMEDQIDEIDHLSLSSSITVHQLFLHQPPSN